MGKVVKKGKITGEMAVKEDHQAAFGVRSRFKTLALQQFPPPSPEKQSNQSASGSKPVQSQRAGQLRSGSIGSLSRLKNSKVGESEMEIDSEQRWMISANSEQRLFRCGTPASYSINSSRSLPRFLLSHSLLNSLISLHRVPSATVSPPCCSLGFSLFSVWILSRRLMASSSSDAVPALMQFRSLDSQPELWYACAGELIHVPPPNSQVYYFVQGHVEHVSKTGCAVDFEDIKGIPDIILCRVEAVNLFLHRPTDEVFIGITLAPLAPGESFRRVDPVEDNTPAPVLKKIYHLLLTEDGSLKIDLTQDCARTFFPEVSAGEYVCFKDLDDRPWKFLLNDSGGEPVLTNGWDEFMASKGLEPWDIVIFMTDRNGELRIGIRRMHKRSYIKLPAELLVRRAKMVADKLSVTVPYFPRLATPEYVIKAARVEAALVSLLHHIRQRQGCSGTRFRMQYENEFTLQACTSVGTVSAVGASDPCRPKSPWRCLQVRVPELSSEVMSVNPWMVNYVNNPNPSGSHPQDQL